MVFVCFRIVKGLITKLFNKAACGNFDAEDDDDDDGDDNDDDEICRDEDDDGDDDDQRCSSVGKPFQSE